MVVEAAASTALRAASPRSAAEQGVWFGELRALLAADPEWFNGTLAREVVG